MQRELLPMPRLLGERSDKGNMILIIIMIAALIIVAMLVIFTVHFVFFAQKRIQTESDELVLRVARQLNEQDHAGFLNNLTMYSRESVFNSRQTSDKIKENANQLEPLARQLLNEAREGAALVNEERKSLVRYTVTQIKKDVDESYSQAKSAVRLPWASYSPPEVKTLQLGSIKDVESNVEAPVGNDELLANDKSSGYLTGSNFYKAGQNLALPDADADLQFKLSSLPAPIKMTISPPRLASPMAFKLDTTLINDGKFGGGTPDVMPSAAKLEITSTVKVSMGKDTQDTSRVWATGVSCGASPPP
jgi:flagellar basal body-associated protein FliL